MCICSPRQGATGNQNSELKVSGTFQGTVYLVCWFLATAFKQRKDLWRIALIYPWLVSPWMYKIFSLPLSSAPLDLGPTHHVLSTHELYKGVRAKANKLPLDHLFRESFRSLVVVISRFSCVIIIYCLMILYFNLSTHCIVGYSGWLQFFKNIKENKYPCIYLVYNCFKENNE